MRYRLDMGLRRQIRVCFAALLGLAGPAAIMPAGASPRPAGQDLCRDAIAAMEHVTGVPDRLMQAIAVVESGRADPAGTVAPWPWTINVEGVGYTFDSKQDAIAAVQQHRAQGAQSIDVGCMQVNLMHHPNAFASLEEAFDPGANARYAAGFLRQLLDQTGSWPLAVAGYHSLTPGIGADYARKVLAIWARPDPARNGAHRTASAASGGQPRPGQTPPLASPPGESGGAPVSPFPSASAARVQPTSGTHMPMMRGRGLDSYRALPTRTAQAYTLRRF